MFKQIDLNCAMGESFGAYTIGSDEKIMEYITSANIACGGHAGDPNVMNKTVKLAKKKNVAVGAHPGFPDIGGFGRRMIDFTPEEIYHVIAHQIGGLQAFCKVHRVTMQHVKPHGALYNKASKNRGVAKAIAQAVFDLNPKLVLFGLAGGELLDAGRKIGLRVASEVFADRTYQPDGTLTPRREENALIKNVNDAVAQVKRMVSDGVVEAMNGDFVKIKADTVCIHGDGMHAVTFAKQMREELEKAQISIASLNK